MFAWRCYWRRIAGPFGGDPASIVRIALQTLAREQFVVPILHRHGIRPCAAADRCDQHLVHLLYIDNTARVTSSLVKIFSLLVRVRTDA